MGGKQFSNVAVRLCDRLRRCQIINVPCAFDGIECLARSCDALSWSSPALPPEWYLRRSWLALY